MATRLRQARRAAGETGILALAPLSTAIAALLTITSVLHVLGEGAWLSVATGQAVGEVGLAVVLWGWQWTGVTRVATMAPDARSEFYWLSVAPRLCLLAPTAVISAVIAMTFPTEFPLEAGAISAATCVYGLTASWFYIGSGQALRNLLVDALPRAVALAVGAATLLVVPSLWVLCAATMLGSCAATIIPLTSIRRPPTATRSNALSELIRRTAAELRADAAAAGSFLLVTLRMNTVILLAPWALGSSAPLIALGDRMLRWVNTGATPLAQAVQVWVPRHASSTPARVRSGLRLGLAGGLLVGVAGAFAIVVASGPLSAGALVVPWTMALPIGVVVGTLFYNAVLGRSALVLLNRTGHVFGAGAISLGVMLAAYAPLAGAWGAAGAFTAFALGEIVGAAYLTWASVSDSHTRVSDANI